MFLLHPLGIEEREMDRVPWVSISIAALCAVMFTVTWVLPADPLGGRHLRDVFLHWEEHPNLEVPAPVRDVLPPQVLPELEEAHQRALEAQGPPDAEVQAELDALLAAHEASTEASLMRRLSLVPARGLRQWGWLLHMFLHFGWLHLLGNLFFFFLTGIMLEDAWGRPLFAGFYGVGGLVAALAHAAMDPASTVPMAGASGAVAACMGAFAFRFATRRVRMGYFVWVVRIWRGTFLMPAWAAGGLWFGAEVLSLAAGTSTGVAVMAHIGGFLFGLAVAVGLRVSGLEERYVTPAVLRKTGNLIRPEGLDRAARALGEGRVADARTLAMRVLDTYPDNLEAKLLLYRADRREGRAGAHGRLDHLFQQLLAQEAPADGFRAVLVQAEEELDLTALRPATAFRMARVVESEPDIAPARLDALDGAASRDPGALGAQALVRLAERAQKARRPEVAREHLEALSRRGTAPAEVVARAEALRAELDRQGQWASGLELERGPAREREAVPAPASFSVQSPTAVAPRATAAPRAGHPPRILRGAVVGESASGLVLQKADGERRPLDFARIVGVAAGLVPFRSAEGGAPRLLPVTDLVLRWGTTSEGPLVLRLELAHLGLQARFPGVPAREAYGRWLQGVMERSGATVLPDAAALRERRYPQYADAHAMSLALYGTATV